MAPALIAAGKAAAAVPWVVAGLTVYQLDKIGYKLLDNDEKK